MNLLVTGAWQGAKENMDKLQQMGHTVAFLQFEKDALPCAYEWVEGVICNGLFLSHPIEKFINLNYIQITSAGLDRIPMDYVKAHGITIHNARGVYSIPMAEYAMGGVLQLYKQAAFFHKNQKAHIWEKHRQLFELYGKTVCIVGCGSIGTECAIRFTAFGCNVIGIATTGRMQEGYREVRPMEELDQVLPQTDILVLAVPLSEETRYLIDKTRLSCMKQNAILVNISRGAVVDTKALEEALKEQNIYGAVLDVFEEEPLGAESALWDMEHVIVTPHNSFVGEKNVERINEIILGNL